MDDRDRPVGKFNYLVEFKDGILLECNINTITVSIYSKINDNSHYIILLDTIINHIKLSTAVKQEYA